MAIHYFEETYRKKTRYKDTQSGSFVSPHVLLYPPRPQSSTKTVLINTIPCQHSVRLLMLFSRPLIIDEQLATPPRAQAAHYTSPPRKKKKLMNKRKLKKGEKGKEKNNDSVGRRNRLDWSCKCGCRFLLLFNV